MESRKDKIVQLIAHGKLEAAISETLSLTKKRDIQTHRIATILSCRYYNLWRDTLIGVASKEEKETVINKVAASLYDIVTKIPDTNG